MAWRTSSSASGASAISPLRTPRERAWPRPTIFSAPSAASSPTTAQTLDVPISSPTMIEEALNMSFLGVYDSGNPGSRGRNRAGFKPAGRDIIGNREIECGDGLAHPLAQVKNLMPPAQLLLQAGQGKNHLAPLLRDHDQHRRRRHVNAFQIHHAG